MLAVFYDSYISLVLTRIESGSNWKTAKFGKVQYLSQYMFSTLAQIYICRFIEKQSCTELINKKLKIIL